MQVQTVQGPVDPADLGIVLIHEHVRFRDEAVAVNWPGRYDLKAEWDAAVHAVNQARTRGVRTIVDPTTMFGGRDVRFMRSVADETGVRIVPCTGIYTYDYLPPYFQNRTVDEMADHFVEDIEVGIQGTDIRAAFLKCAADAPGVTENVEKVHRAVARASVRTGAPIMAHSRPASNTAPRQVDILVEEGVDPAKIQIAHAGDSDTPDEVEALLDRGVWVGLDRFGLEFFRPFEQRVASAVELLRRGYADRIFLSQDHCATTDYFTVEVQAGMYQQGLVRQGWSMTVVLDDVVPRLQEHGVLDGDVFRTVFEDNPRRWLAG